MHTSGLNPQSTRRYRSRHEGFAHLDRLGPRTRSCHRGGRRAAAGVGQAQDLNLGDVAALKLGGGQADGLARGVGQAGLVLIEIDLEPLGAAGGGIADEIAARLVDAGCGAARQQRQGQSSGDNREDRFHYSALRTTPSPGRKNRRSKKKGRPALTDRPLNLTRKTSGRQSP